MFYLSANVSECGENVTYIEGEVMQYICFNLMVESTDDVYGYVNNSRPYLSLQNHDTGEMFGNNNTQYQQQSADESLGTQMLLVV